MVSSFMRSGGVAAVVLAAGIGTAWGDDKPADVPAGWWDAFKLSGHVELGFTGNVDSPSNRLNFGRLFDDKSNQLLLNQALVTAERPLDPKAEGYDFGFRLQGLYGSDARYTHFLGEFDRSIHDRNQFDIVEANLQAHVPEVVAGGIDLKLGQYATPIGFEVIDAAANPFYSHSYIFNFGIPLKHTGGYAVAHVNDTLDLWLGGDTGVNTSLGRGDNNKAAALMAGFGLNNLLDGKLTVLALTHIGPENPQGTAGIKPNSDLRYLSDIVITYKPDDALSLTTELNFARDDGFHAIAYGAAQYAAYTIDDRLTLNARAEVFRDNGNNKTGFFVSAFPNALDYVDAERGIPAQTISAPPTTYGELTIGAAIKPPVPEIIKDTVLRPELRWDKSLNGTNVFDAGKKTSQVTLAVDLVVPF